MRFFEIVDQVLTYVPEADLSLLEKAYVFSAKVHCGRIRLPGEPYLAHPLAVAGILTQMYLDEESIVAGLLHDVFEEGWATPEEVQSLFGENVVRIIQGVEKLNQLEFNYREDSQHDYFRKMIMAMSQDMRVVLVRLADLLHNMQSLPWKDVKEREIIAQEVLDIYAPLSARLGIDWLKRNLEDAAFKCLHPDIYRKIVRDLAKTEEERCRYIEKVKRNLLEAMEKNGLKGRVLGRFKHIYSIYKKMLRQGKDLYHLHDLLAFRIILESVKDCYEVLGIVQALWEPVPGRFKDYIVKPKNNMYQSLHTTVTDPDGERLEIQIRTEEMDKLAKTGMAAHWIYKENKSSGKVDNDFWLHQLMDLKKEKTDTEEPPKAEDQPPPPPDEVYVFTPEKEVRVLPKGATPVDFAYLIHTQVGHHCVGARVNGKIVPLRHELQNGDSVEILTAKNHHPSKDWLKFVKTSKARDRIRRWIKTEEKERSVALGKEICEKEFRKKGLSFNHYINSPELEEVAQSLSLKSVEELLVGIAYKKISPLHVIGKLSASPNQEEESQEKIVSFEKRKPGKTDSGIRVEGADDVMIRIARCCNPLPGEPIIGYITRGRGVTVHRTSCKNLSKGDLERQIEVQWDTGNGENYPVDIKVAYFGGKGMVGALNAILSQLDANVVEVHMDSKMDGLDVCRLKIEVKDTTHLRRIIAALKGEKGVHLVQRSA